MWNYYTFREVQLSISLDGKCSMGVVFWCPNTLSVSVITLSENSNHHLNSCGQTTAYQVIWVLFQYTINAYVYIHKANFAYSFIYYYKFC